MNDVCALLASRAHFRVTRLPSAEYRSWMAAMAAVSVLPPTDLQKRPDEGLHDATAALSTLWQKGLTNHDDVYSDNVQPPWLEKSP
ncbi:hypothetical protein GOP47_0025331 [Adiantum capillus-veneris]|uniref:Uncharacterized protein n=1 Tax=Adiantum capillus-veneris TaxID=13818 RepID=A0A9D4U0L1_ADICA|nr:hypothetical protein GOP47_0025331 [Adiantum capillus-veneris]